MSKKLKRSHKGLMLVEASFVYCRRKNLPLSFEEFIDDIFLQEDFEDGGEFDRICDDIRMRSFTYRPSTNNELSEYEWNSVLEEFGIEDEKPKKVQHINRIERKRFTNRHLLEAINYAKSLCVQACDYESAANIRDIEKKYEEKFNIQIVQHGSKVKK